MTPRISLITVVAVALVAVPAAWGKGQAITASPDAFERAVAAQVDFWNYDQQTGKQITNSSPGVAPQGLATLYSDGSDVSAPIVSPDAVDRVKALQLSTSSKPHTSPDAFERAVAGRITTDNHFLANDNRFRIDPSTNPAPISATSSGRELDWPQIGIGFGLGIVLALGLYVAMRYSRTRPLAH